MRQLVFLSPDEYRCVENPCGQRFGGNTWRVVGRYPCVAFIRVRCVVGGGLAVGNFTQRVWDILDLLGVFYRLSCIESAKELTKISRRAIIPLL